MNTYGLREAATIAKVHYQTLRQMAASKDPGRPPGTKIGRAWVFPTHLFDAWIENKCLPSTSETTLKSGGAVGQSLATRIAKRREQLIAKRLKNSKSENDNDCGDSTS